MDAAALNSDIQAELQTYMDEHDLNRLFAGMVEAVLMDQPRRPEAFLVSYLIKNFGEKIDLEALGLRRTAGNVVAPGPRSGVAGPAGGGGAAGAGAGKSKAPAEEESGEESGSGDSDDDDDDVVDELPAFRSTRGTARRESVSAEASVDPRVLKAQWAAERKVYPKSDNDRRRLRTILLENILFQRLDDEQLDIVLDALSSVTFKDGKQIIKQGDAGDLFYVVESGSPEVYVESGGKSTKVVTYRQGDSFGELALMYNAPRAASVIAKGDCQLWALDRLTFKVILMDTTGDKRRRYEAFLSRVPVLATLSDYERLTIADALVQEEFPRGAVICLQGEPGNKFYIIEKGEVAITQKASPTSPAVEVMRCKPGAYFGEIALLTNQPRKATATAAVPTMCLTLDRRTFSRVMGPLEDVLKRNMETYGTVMAKLEDA